MNPPAPPPLPVLAAKPAPAVPVSLAWAEFFQTAPRGALVPSAKLLALHNRRVRLVGFMAQMEAPPRGAFYLCARPVFCDESGGGTAELPPETVRVWVRGAADRAVPFDNRPLQVTGVLQVGREAGAGGQVSFIRLLLDRPQDFAPPPANASPTPFPGKK